MENLGLGSIISVDLIWSRSTYGVCKAGAPRDTYLRFKTFARSTQYLLYFSFVLYSRLRLENILDYEAFLAADRWRWRCSGSASTASRWHDILFHLVRKCSIRQIIGNAKLICYPSGDSYTQTNFDINGTQPSAGNPMGNPTIGESRI